MDAQEKDAQTEPKDQEVNGHDTVIIVNSSISLTGEHQRLEHVVNAVKNITEDDTLKSINWNGD